jgi:hypothetical protein
VILAALLFAAAGLELGLPVDCDYGRTCFVQNYVDLDAGPGRSDFTCGHLTYDGHKGTDFRPADPRPPLTVRAAAAGAVKARRDGVPDGQRTSGQECGNGVLLDHGEGWQTQYCHMAAGSVRVRVGEQVARGQPLGVVGRSGETAFLHLHFELRKDGVTVDPFLGSAETRCGATPAPLWSPPLRYIAPALLGLGFTAVAPTLASLEAGQHRGQTLPAASEQLVVWAHVLGPRAGDRERLRLIAPDGAVLIDAEREATPRDRADHLYFAIKRRRGAWLTGVYRGEYRMSRDSVEVVAGEATVEVRP